MRRTPLVLVVAVAVACLAVALAGPASAADTHAGAAGSYEVTFVPNNQPGFSYEWSLQPDHTMAGGGFTGTWRYGRLKGFVVTYNAPSDCVFIGAGTPGKGFSGDYECPSGTIGTWSTGPRE